MKILFLSRWFPYPTNNGSKLRIYNLLCGLAQCHDVTLLTFGDQQDMKSDVTELQLLCSDIHVVLWKEFDPHSFRAHLGFFSLKPRSVIDTFSEEMAQKITKLLRAHDYDLVIASQLSMAAYHPYFKKVPALFEEVEIGLSYGEVCSTLDLKKQIRHSLTWFKFHLFLQRLLSSFQGITVASEQERELLARNFLGRPGAVKVIPNCVQTGEYENYRRDLVPNQLIFSGSFRYYPNYEAMLWFVRDVYPCILKEIPNAHLVITGDHAGLSLPSTPNVTFVGYVDDIKTMIASSWVSVAPLLSGGGTRLKILEAMALGTPVVSTLKGAEGLSAKAGEHLFVADSSQDFADAIVKIMKNKGLRDQIALQANQFVKENYAWEAVMPQFLQFVECTAAR